MIELHHTYILGMLNEADKTIDIYVINYRLAHTCSGKGTSEKPWASLSLPVDQYEFIKYCLWVLEMLEETEET